MQVLLVASDVLMLAMQLAVFGPHTSYLDGPMVGAIFRCTIVAKRSIFNIPLVGGTFRAFQVSS